MEDGEGSRDLVGCLRWLRRGCSKRRGEVGRVVKESDNAKNAKSWFAGMEFNMRRLYPGLEKFIRITVYFALTFRRKNNNNKTEYYM